MKLDRYTDFEILRDFGAIVADVLAGATDAAAAKAAIESRGADHLRALAARYDEDTAAAMLRLVAFDAYRDKSHGLAR